MILIKTFGQFSITVDDCHFEHNMKKPSNMWKLLALFIAHRNKFLSMGYISEAIWSENMAENPVKAIQNLVYRLRKTFDNVNDLFIYNNYSYTLDTTQFFTVDAYLFEDFYKECMRPNTNRIEKKKMLQELIDLYSGDYLVDMYAEPWAIILLNQYKRMFIESVLCLSDIYLDEQNYTDSIRLCEKALLYEPLEESIYVNLIRSLKYSHNKIQAISICERLFDMLYREFRIKPSIQISNLYLELKSSIEPTQKHGVDLKSFFTEEIVSALRCDRNTFKSILNYKLRQRLDIKQNAYILIITLQPIEGKKIAFEMISDATNHLIETCLFTLRRGDVVSQYSENQILILLSSLNSNAVEQIMFRVKNRFYELCAIKDIQLQYHLESIVRPQWLEQEYVDEIVNTKKQQTYLSPNCFQ